jgi:DNA-binding MarR family transcriptional regulator
MAGPRVEDLERVIDEVRLLWNALVRRGDALHEREALTMGMRAILELLQRGGPATVPRMARSRGVSRQHVQSLVNPLLERGLLRAEINPAHKRSPLMALTPRGERTITRMRRREAALLERATLHRSSGELTRTAEILREIRRALDERG